MNSVNLPGGKGGGSKRLTLAPTVEIIGDKILPTEAFAKSQYQLGKEAERALCLGFGLDTDQAFEIAEERIRGRANAMAFFFSLVFGLVFQAGVATLAGWWK